MKIGKIIKVEDATQKQKNKKEEFLEKFETFFEKVATLGAGVLVGSFVTVGAIAYEDYEQQEQVANVMEYDQLEQSNLTTNKDNFIKIGDDVSPIPTVVVYQQEQRINNEWTKGEIVFYEHGAPEDSENVRHILLGVNRTDKPTLVWQKEIRTRINDETFSDWQKLEDYVVSIVPPQDDFETRYILSQAYERIKKNEDTNSVERVK